MAAAANGRDVYYLTFGDRKLCDDIAKFYEFARERDMRVKALWQLVADYGEMRCSKTGKKCYDEDVFSFVIRNARTERVLSAN
jgi:hypothetical protein